MIKVFFLLTARCNGSAVMADGGSGAADAGAGAGAGAVAGESAARGAALERAYVHDVYEQAGEDGDEAIRAPAPGVRTFLSELEPGSLVCDVGEYLLYMVKGCCA